MATADRELSIVLRVVNGELMNGISQAEGAIKNFASNSVSALDQVEERTENLRHVWKGLFEAFIGVEVIDALKRIALAADDAADRINVAANTAKNFGNSLDPTAMENWLRAFANSAQGGGYALTDMRDAVQKFAAIGLNSDQIKRATADVANLAATFGFSFPEAVTIAQRALTGHVEMLTRYGIISREAAKNIHTVEQAMDALEKATAGGAEKRADELAGAFGRLGNAVEKLADSFGKYLIPYFDAVANALTNMANAFAALPPWLQEAAAAITFVSLSLTGLGLMLPAVKLAVEFLAGGFGLLGAIMKMVVTAFTGVAAVAPVTSDVMAALAAKEISASEAAELMNGQVVLQQGLLTRLSSVVIGPLMGAFNGLVSILRTVITAIGVDLVGADTAAAASFAAMAAPILAVIAVLAGVVAAVVALSGHWNDAMKGLSTAWDEFYNNVIRKADNLKRIFAALVLAVNPSTMAVGSQELSGALHDAMPKTTAWIDAGVKDATDAVVGAVKKAWNSIVGFFKGATTNVGVPHDAFTGRVPGKGAGDTASKAAENALKNFDEATKNWLDTFASRVTAAQARVDAAKAKLDEYTAGLAGGKPQTAQQEAQYQALLNQQLDAESNLRQATLEQMSAQEHAAQKYLDIAKEISPHLKNHDQLVRQALDAARQHNDEANRLNSSYQQLGVTLAQIAAQARDVRDAYIEARGELDVQNARNAYDSRQQSRSAQTEAVQHQEAMAKINGGGTISKVSEDQYAVELARIALAAAQDNEALLKHAAAVAEDTARETGTLADKQKAIEAENQATQALNTRIQAENRLNESLAQLTKDIDQRKNALTTALDQLVKKLNVPGLSETPSGGFTFSPLEFLIAAFEQTKSFADIMSLVNQIVRVFAQLLDNLRPVILIVLEAVRDVANVFIFLYNTVARILRLLGIHLQLLNELNSVYQNSTIPLIQITHEIPTLNELAAGKLNSPLSLIPQGLQNVNNNLVSIGQTHTSLLESILGAVLALKVVMMLFGGGGAGGGGILGFLGHLFNFGNMFGGAASAGADMGTLTTGISDGLSGALNAIGTIPDQAGMTDAVSQGVQSALATDGASTSGGLYTSMSNAMTAAAPYLISAAGGFVVGSLLEPGRKDAALGGAAGATLGFALGGPIGAIIGALGGTLLGGLFGGPRGAGSQPDLHDPTFGQKEANLTGKQFGTQGFGKFQNQSGYSQGILDYIQQNLAKGYSAFQGFMSQQQFNTLLSEFGTTGGGQIKYGHNIENESVIGGSLSGNYNTIYQDAVQAAQQIAGVLGNGATSFTDLLHQGTDVHSWMDNQLTQQAVNALQVVGTSANAMTKVTNNLATAIDTMNSVNNGTTLNHSMNVGSVHLHTPTDIADLGKDLADAQMRRIKTSQWSLGRAPIG